MNLVYADGNTPGIGMVGAGCDINDFTEVSPAGPQAVTAVALPPGGAFLRLTAANSGDNGYNGHLAVDGVTFTTGPLPCTLWFSSPLGPGSIQMENLPCPPVGGADYIIGIVLVQGSTPGGWFFGLDIPWNQLVSEYNSGYPFAGTLDGAGYSNFGPIVGAPSGLQLWAVSTQWAPGLGRSCSSVGSSATRFRNSNDRVPSGARSGRWPRAFKRSRPFFLGVSVSQVPCGAGLAGIFAHVVRKQRFRCGPKGGSLGCEGWRERVPLSVVFAHGERSSLVKSTLCLCLLLAGAAFGQADFELQAPACGYAFPVGCGAIGDLEGCARNGAFGVCTVDVANGLGMPTAGVQYARVGAQGPFAVPAGGPAPEPAAGVTNQFYVPIAVGATTLSFTWDFYTAEGGGSGFNDGLSIDIVGPACGPSMVNLAYADDTTSVVAGGQDSLTGCGSFGLDTVTVGPQVVVGVVVPPGAAYIRMMVWNGGDNAVASHGVMDEVTFTTGPTPCSLWFSSPLGPGSIQMENLPCPPLAGASYLIGIVLTQGLTPNGWFFGLDIPYTQLVNEFQSGYPFAGTLDANGYSSFGPIVGAPSGLQVWAVSTQWAPGFGPFLFSRALKTYTIP